MRLVLSMGLAITVSACGDGAAGGGGPDLGTVREWAALRPLPAARQETAVVELAGLIYVIGGFNDRTLIVDTVERYDPATNEWAAVRPLPRALHHANAAVVDGKIYVVGALTLVAADAFSAIGDIYEYDPGSNTWTMRGTMPAGSERGASLVAALDGEIFVAGGLRGGAAVADFSSYAPGNGQTTPRKPMPMARDHGVGAAVGGKLYTIGGRATGINAHTASVHMYDPVTDEWSPRAPMTTSRGGAAGAVVNGRIVVAGGEGNADRPTGVFDQTELYDPVGNTWQSLAPMRTARHGTSAAGIGDRFYVPGGATTAGFGAVADLEALRITP